ncbi:MULTISPECIES: plasmid partitioning protein RepB [Rhizobium]|uniref:plasmid partitioning protein RepB n=1 Tax=Rhizobium TaxID=379 RepID=UPI00103D81EF|nr:MULTISPECIES: plasmid partitioning protein RepB [Rhizobium]MBY4592235.1 plasmid partitioning protein RepB [Rhizobium redzepovicii]MBY4617166.1 plasmid partitioning protein RepB [Rhizobium redzepovicii]TBY44469.1 plasmid partitioning protein RepB [Rhizobium leguminosarum bv. viciae]
MGTVMTNAKERSSRMKSLFANVDSAELAKQISAGPAVKVGSGAVKSMDRAFVAVEEENERLRLQLSSSEAIVEIDSALVVPSFVRDRLDIEGDPQFQGFVEGIRENGQRLPILVRPSPDRQGYFQVAYGHRRLRACQILERPVRAIVRDLSDDELVVAQGIENTERANLSFIEQAFFAATLKARGFRRETIAAALGRADGKLTYVSMLIGIAEQVPAELIGRIGPAPSIGRPKWEKLAAHFKDGKAPAAAQAIIDKVTSTAVWAAATSDHRFAALMSALEHKAARGSQGEEVDVGGGAVITAKSSRSSTLITIPESKVPGLSAWLVERLPALVEEYRKQTGEAPMG